MMARASARPWSSSSTARSIAACTSLRPLALARSPLSWSATRRRSVSAARRRTSRATSVARNATRTTTSATIGCPTVERRRVLDRANVDRDEDAQRSRRSLHGRAVNDPEPERGEREGQDEHQAARARRVAPSDQGDGNGFQRVGPDREPPQTQRDGFPDAGANQAGSRGHTERPIRRPDQERRHRQANEERHVREPDAPTVQLDDPDIRAETRLCPSEPPIAYGRDPRDCTGHGFAPSRVLRSWQDGRADGRVGLHADTATGNSPRLRPAETPSPGYGYAELQPLPAHRVHPAESSPGRRHRQGRTRWAARRLRRATRRTAPCAGSDPAWPAEAAAASPSECFVHCGERRSSTAG